MQDMDPHFTEREDGQVDVDLGPEWSLVTEALNDSVSSLPPCGAKGNRPSTYWVDVVTLGLNRALTSAMSTRSHGGTALCCGSEVVESKPVMTSMRTTSSQFLDVNELQRILAEWRRRILDSASASTSPLPETYRRNPDPTFAV